MTDPTGDALKAYEHSKHVIDPTAEVFSTNDMAYVIALTRADERRAILEIVERDRRNQLSKVLSHLPPVHHVAQQIAADIRERDQQEKARNAPRV